MDYYEQFNLSREPFSSSPDPDMFYPSRSRVDCLSQLKIAIRLRRGLSVVIGGVGSGKTTLCRVLIRELAKSSGIDACLILSADFDSRRDFLVHFARTLGIAEKNLTGDDTELAGLVKTNLWERNRTQNRTVCLIVDEGQVISRPCSDAIEELLAEEDADGTLLQVVVFGQNEFVGVLNDRPGLAGQVAGLHVLKPFRFAETRDMVATRIDLSVAQGLQKPRFSLAALAYLHFKSGGYPRKIVRLCHRSLLSAASGRVVRLRHVVKSAKAHVFTPRSGPDLGKRAAMAAALLAVLVWVGFAVFGKPPATQTPPVAAMSVQPAAPETKPEKPKSAPAKNEAAAKAQAQPEPAVPAKTAEAPAPAKAEPAPPAQAATEQASADTPQPAAAETTPQAAAPAEPEVIGKVALGRNWALRKRLDDLYGRSNSQVWAELAKANPKIRDIKQALAGATIAFPPIPAQAPPEGARLVSVGKFENLGQAFDFMVAKNSQKTPLRLFALRTPAGETRIEAVLDKVFPNQDQADKALAKLPPELAGSVAVLSGFDGDNAYFSEIDGYANFAALPEPAPPAPQAAPAPAKPAEPVQAAAPAEPVESAPAAAPVQAAAEAVPAKLEPPAALGQVKLKPGWSFARRLEDVYGRRNKAVFDALAKANPKMESIFDAGPGALVVFPAVATAPPEQNAAFISLARPDDLSQALDFIVSRSTPEAGLKLFATFDPEQGAHLDVIWPKTYASPEQAFQAKAALPADLAAQAKVLAGFPPETVFYSVAPPAAKALDKPGQAAAEPAQPLLGQAELRPGWALWKRIDDLYGRRGKEIFDALVKANPGMTSVVEARQGAIVNFPAISAPPPPPAAAYVSVAAPQSLADAFEAVVAGSTPKTALRLFVSQAPGGPARFDVILAKQFHSAEAAQKAAAELPPDLATNARVLGSFEQGTVFYSSAAPAPLPAAQRPAPAEEPGHTPADRTPKPYVP